MIDEDITFREKGYRSTDLKPKSHNDVWRVCNGCGVGRWIEFRYCVDLCPLCAIKDSCREKCETQTEKRDCIDDDITFEEKGYHSTDLKPQSSKEVWRVCLECGDGRWVEFRACTDLCIKCANSTDEKREKCSETNRGRIHTEKFREKVSKATIGENNPMYGRNGKDAPGWKGGISFEPYCEKFNEAFKESIREKFGRKCFMCPTTEEENKRKLCVHHVNYDKECMCNGVDCEFVPLCIGCHAKTNHSRELWERLIINVLSYEGWID